MKIHNWSKSIGEERDIGDISPPQLDKKLRHFSL